jgi:hypothetical protein
MIYYNDIKYLNNYTGKDGDLANVDLDQYRYNKEEKSWKPYAPIKTSLASSLDIIKRSGVFRCDLNESNTLSASASNPILSDFKSSVLMAEPLNESPGEWFSFNDSYGTVMTPLDADIVNSIIFAGNLEVSATLGGDTSKAEYPYAGVGFDILYNASNISQSEKRKLDITSYTGITITYSSTQPLDLQLQSQKSGDGADWFYELPSTNGNKSTITLTWSQFAQPSWVTGTEIRTIPTNCLTNMTFQYATQQTTIIFTLYEISLVGDGVLVPIKISLSNDYSNYCLQSIEKWFDLYYIESDDGRYGRIKWLDSEHDDPLITVSESMGYAIKLATIASKLGNDDIYYQRISKLVEFWNNNLDTNGLMDWKVSGWRAYHC